MSITLSRSDLFLVLVASSIMVFMVTNVLRVTIFSYLARRNLKPIPLPPLDPAETATLNAALDSVKLGLASDRDMQAAAFHAGWRASEECGDAAPASDEHVEHHFHWRDAAHVTTKCARADRPRGTAPASVTCSVIGAKRDGTASLACDADTGELFAAVPLVTITELYQRAADHAPCTSDCGNAGCALARTVLTINRDLA